MHTFRISFLLSALLYGLIFPVAAQVPEIDWEKSFGGTGEDQMYSSIPTPDGGTLLAGSSNSGVSEDKGEANKGSHDYWVLKLDITGKKDWDKTYGGGGEDVLRSAISTSDGGYLLAGYSSSGPSGNKVANHYGINDYWVVKLNASGGKEWDKSFGGSGNEILISVIQTADGGYLLGGFSSSGKTGVKSEEGKGGNDYWVVKLKSSGEIDWDKTYGGTGNDQLYSVIEIPNEGFLLGGHSDSNESEDKAANSFGGLDYWVLRVNPSGTILWEQTYGGPGTDFLSSVSQTPDGKFLLGGRSDSGELGSKTSYNRGGNDYWIIKINRGGNKEWDKTFGGEKDDGISNVLHTSDKGFLLIGTSASNKVEEKTEVSRGGHDFWIVKLNETGTLEWNKTFGGVNFDILYAAHIAADGDFLLAGSSESSNSGEKESTSKGGYDFWAVKLKYDHVFPSKNPVLEASGECLPDITLSLNPASDPTKIIWLKDGSGVHTATPTTVSSGTTVAGKDRSGSGDEYLNYAYGLYVDGEENVYVADGNNHRVQKWTKGASSGVTVAGYESGQLNQPEGVHVDAEGNVYVAEWGNHRIQKWQKGARTGETIAGGTEGFAANQLKNPSSVFVTDNGDIYIADTENHRIQKWAKGASSGVTVAGGNGKGIAANQLSSPEDVFVADNGDIFIADTENHRIQKWSPGAISGYTVAGGKGAGVGDDQFNRPFGIFLDARGNIYVSDLENHRVQKWFPGASKGVTVAGGNSGGKAPEQFNRPYGIHVDGSGNIFVADHFNHRVQKWNGTIETTFVPTEGGEYSASVTYPSGTITTKKVTVEGAKEAKVSISASPSTTITAGTEVTFTAVPTHGGDNPKYQWYINGEAVSGATGVTFKSSTLQNEDEVSCSLTSDALCVEENTVYSNILTITVTELVLSIKKEKDAEEDDIPGEFILELSDAFHINLSVSFRLTGTAIPGDDYSEPTSPVTIPAGTKRVPVPVNVKPDKKVEGNETVVLTLEPVGNDGVKLDESNKSATLSIIDDDKKEYKPELEASDRCLPDVTLTISDATDATKVSWFRNGNPVNTASPTDQTSFTPTESGEYSASVTYGSETINTNKVTIGETKEVEISITADPSTTITAGTEVSFTAVPTHGGDNPEYEWRINGKPVPGATSPTFKSSSLKNQDVVTCSLTSDEPCADENSVSSNPLTMTVNSVVLSVQKGKDAKEDNEGGNFVVHSTAAFPFDVTINFTLSNISASPGKDFTSPEGNKVVLEAGDKSVNVEINVLPDKEAEGDETVELTLSSRNDEILIDENAASATIKIIDDEECFTLTQTITPLSCEGTADGGIDVTIEGASSELSFNWSNGHKGEDLGNLAAGIYQLEVKDNKTGCTLKREYTIEANDKVPPVVKARGLKVQLNENGQVTISANDLDDGSTDNCGIKGFSVDKSSFNCSDLGDNQVSLTVEDLNGNIASATAIVEVEDKLPPVIAGGQQFSVQQDAQLNTLIGTVQAEDNCKLLGWQIIEGNEGEPFKIEENGQMSLVADLASDKSEYSLKIEVTDGFQTVEQIVTIIIVDGVDEPGPSANGTIEDQEAFEDEAFSFTIPQEVFSYANPEELVYSVVEGPGWLTFDPTGRQFGGTPQNEDVKVSRITIRATNKEGNYAEQFFDLVVRNTNDAPHDLSLSGTKINEEQPEGTLIGRISAEDVDANDQHTYKLVEGTEKNGKEYFKIEGNEIFSAVELNFEKDTLLTIRIRVTDESGEFFEKDVDIEVIATPSGEIIAFLPTLFTPNGDQQNDLFLLRASDLEKINWRIFNRQGRVVFETKNIQDATTSGWDGTLHGEPQPEDSYIWVLEGSGKDGKPVLVNGKTSGSVTLIR